MNKTLLTAVSVLALMASGPVYADSTHPAKPGSKAAAEQSTGSVSKDAQKAWKNIKKDTSEAAEDISEATSEVYKDAKHALTKSDDPEHSGKVKINLENTANGMIGEPVYNASGDRIAKVHDIILDRNGNATMVVLADGDFTGLGKLAAFDYSTVTKRSDKGDIMTSLTEATIDQAATFSYDPSENTNNVRVIPNNGYSVSELLDGVLVDQRGKSLAAVDNIVFRDAQADQIIVKYDQVLGLGGDEATMGFDDAEIKNHNNQYKFVLNATNSEKFRQFKNQATN